VPFALRHNVDATQIHFHFLGHNHDSITHFAGFEETHGHTQSFVVKNPPNKENHERTDKPN